MSEIMHNSQKENLKQDMRRNSQLFGRDGFRVGRNFAGRKQKLVSFLASENFAKNYHCQLCLINQIYTS